MIKSKVVRIVLALDHQERKRLHLYLQSPYLFQHAQADKIRALNSLILTESLDDDQNQLTKEQVFKSLFPGEEMIKGKIEKLMTALLQTVRKFILNEELQRESEIKQHLTRAFFFRRKGLVQDFNNSMENARRSKRKARLKNLDFHLHAFQLEQIATNYEGYYNSRIDHLNILTTLDHLDIYHWVAKLEYYCMFLGQTCNDARLQDKISESDIERLEENIKKLDLLQDPRVNTYFHALQLLKNHDEKTFSTLCELLNQHRDELPDECSKSLSAVCRNFCVEQYNAGEEHYLKILFKLYLTHLKEGYLQHENQLLSSTFRNMVTMGLRFQKFDWVFSFMKEYKHQITGCRFPGEVYKFNLANYHFALKKYEKALALLPDNYEDLYYTLAAKRLALKIYYEIKSPLLPSKMDAFKIYIFRLSKKKLPDIPRQGNNHFIDALRQVYLPSTLRNNSRIDKLIQKLNKTKVVLEKDWLNEKLITLKVRG